MNRKGATRLGWMVIVSLFIISMGLTKIVRGLFGQILTFVYIAAVLIVFGVLFWRNIG